MKLKAGEINAYLADPGTRYVLALVYGPDTGLVRERADMLMGKVVSDPKDPFLTTDLAEADIKSDPARLADEAAAMALTGGRRAVRLRGATDSSAKSVETLLAAPAGESLVILEAGDLSPRSKLRKCCEAARNAVTIPCYADDERALGRLIGDVLAGAGLRATADARAYLADVLGGDRALSRQELMKLCLYKGASGEDTEVSLADAQAVVGDSSARDLDDLVFAASGGNAAETARILARLVDEGTNAVATLRAVSRHFQRLHLVKSLIEGGENESQAMKALRPPVFFKRADAFRVQLRYWSLPGLERALANLAEAEAACKTTGLPAGTICDRALMRLAATAARGARRAA